MTQIIDEFRGDTERLRDSIKALIEMNDSDGLVPHGIGGHARTLLAAAYHRLAAPSEGESGIREALRPLRAYLNAVKSANGPSAFPETNRTPVNRAMDEIATEANRLLKEALAASPASGAGKGEGR